MDLTTGTPLTRTKSVPLNVIEGMLSCGADKIIYFRRIYYNSSYIFFAVIKRKTTTVT